MSHQLGRYTLLGKLATGGMAEVFLARLDGTGGFERRVVIKRVLPQYASQPEFLHLFEQEARFASFLSHPHIAIVSDFGVDPAGAAYLVMEHVDGASLRAVLREATRQNELPDVRLVSRIFSQVAGALAAVHSTVDPLTGHTLDLVHRDVSPENVLLSRQGAVKLADFGIARAMNEVSLTRPDVVRGKLRYLAPEQVLGETLSPAVDVWALGVSLYEALALRRPFPEGSDAQTVHAIVHGEFVPLESLRRDVPPELLAVVTRCLRRAPADRYPDCQDLALDLERIASSGSASITTRVVGNWVERLCAPTALQPLGPEPQRPTPLSPGLFLPPQPEDGPELELAPRTPAAPEELPVPGEIVARRPARWPRVGGVLFGALLLVAGGLVARRQLGGREPRRQVLVTSSPAGATVKHGTLVLGQTPWAGDLPSLHAVELELSAPGYHTARRTLAPGDLAGVDVTLKRSR